MASLPPLLSELQFGSLLVYSPRGSCKESRKSRDVTYGIKAFRPRIVELALDRLREVVENGLLRDLFGTETVLIPAPRSSPLVKGALWPAWRICIEMISRNIGSECQPRLTRIKAVPKSAYSRRGERPTVKDHLDSMHCETALLSPESIVVVDDVVTKGSTLLAASSQLHSAFPQAKVKGFALVRTIGLKPEIEKILEPCLGRIWIDRWKNVRRKP